MLMKLFCSEVDKRNLDALVMSSPAGVRLYSNFGFEMGNFVQTDEGEFTSMLRTSECGLGREDVVLCLSEQ